MSGITGCFNAPRRTRRSWMLLSSVTTECLSTHAMLIHSLLLNSLWTYAAEYATHIFNCLLTNTSSGFMSAYKARYDLVPDVSHLCMLDAFVTVTSRRLIVPKILWTSRTRLTS